MALFRKYAEGACFWYAGLYIKALASGVDEILSAYRQTLLRIEEQVCQITFIGVVLIS